MLNLHSLFPSLFPLRETRSIQELEQTVELLEASRMRYERIFGGEHGYGFMDWDIVNQKINWSGGFWSYLGYSATDMEYMADPNISLEYVHEDDRRYLQKTIAAVFRGDEDCEVIFRFRKKRGGYLWTEFRFACERDYRGLVRFLSGVAFDISHLKQTEDALLASEKRHSRIIQSSNDGIWEWSAKRGEFHFSDRCWQQLGYSEKDDSIVLGKDRVKVWRSLMHPDDLVLFDESLQNHIAQKTPYDIEYRIKGKNGKYRWVRSRGQMSFSETGEPLRMSGTNMDITELKRVEKRALKAKEEAERANRAKSEFLSSMSHELRTPLNAILAYSQLLEMDSNLGEDQRLNNSEIKKAGLHLKQLVGDVLDLAKIESGNIQLEMENTCVYDVVQECLLLVRSQVQKKNLKVILHPNKNNRVEVHASPVHLRQIILNLLVNAVKYNREKGSIEIQFHLTQDLKLSLEISDTGFGIPKHRQGALFQPFSRLSENRGQVEGSGVGLVITEKLVKQMKGEIGFQSKEGEGSRFWVNFPAIAGSEMPVANLTKGNYSDTELDQKLCLNLSKPKSILYIEDNRSNQKVMEQIIERFPELGLRVEREGIRGVYAARTYRPDLILLDISLPGMDGYEILEILQKDPATHTIPKVALSANAMSQDIEKGINRGFADYLTKPIDVVELVALFNRFLSDGSVSSSNAD